MFKSRWGFHPCDFQTFRKLKLLHRLYLQSVRLARAWDRWQRKEPQNRVMRRRIRNEKGQTIGYEPPIPLPEPRICPVFSQKVFEKRHVDRYGNFSREGFAVEKVVTDDFSIHADYATARRPVPDQGGVGSLHHTLASIEELYRKAQAWLEEQDLK